MSPAKGIVISVAIELEIDTESGVVFSHASGRVTDKDLLEHHRRIEEDPDFDPSMNHLFDFMQVESVDLSPEGIRALASRNPFSADSRRALVADHSNPLLFGMLRMYEAWCNQNTDKMRVQYDHLDEGRRWVMGDEVSE